MRSKSQTAWETAARCATLAQEADEPEEHEHYARLRDAWTTLAKRCEPFNIPDVTDTEKIDGPIPVSFAKNENPARVRVRRGSWELTGRLLRRLDTVRSCALVDEPPEANMPLNWNFPAKIGPKTPFAKIARVR
jgi:hypothetical protein